MWQDDAVLVTPERTSQKPYVAIIKVRGLTVLVVVFHLLNVLVVGSMEFLAKPGSIGIFVCIIKETKT
jgi:hypothetical protein